MSPLTPHFTLDRNEILALLTFWKTIVHWQFHECLPYIDPTKFSISIDECNTLAAKSLFTLRMWIFMLRPEIKHLLCLGGIDCMNLVWCVHVCCYMANGQMKWSE